MSLEHNYATGGYGSYGDYYNEDDVLPFFSDEERSSKYHNSVREDYEGVDYETTGTSRRVKDKKFLTYINSLCPDGKWPPITHSPSHGVFMINPQFHKVLNPVSAKPVDEFFFLQNACFTQSWDHINGICKEIIRKNSSQFWNKLSKFVKDQHLKYPKSGFIPAAWLFLGSSIPDHLIFIQLLTSKIKYTKNCFVVKLLTSTCASLAEAVDSIVRQVFPNSRTAQGPSLATIKDHFDTLDNPCLVIVIESIERFPHTIIDDFFHLMNKYAISLRIILVFCISTTIHMIHNRIPHSILISLNSVTFKTNDPETMLDQLLTKITLKCALPFDFGPNSYEWLLNQIQFYSNSFTSLMNQIKFCLFEFCYSNPLSYLFLDNANFFIKTTDDLFLFKNVLKKNAQLHPEELEYTKLIWNSRKEIIHVFQVWRNQWILQRKKFHTLLRCYSTMVSTIMKSNGEQHSKRYDYVNILENAESYINKYTQMIFKEHLYIDLPQNEIDEEKSNNKIPKYNEFFDQSEDVLEKDNANSSDPFQTLLCYKILGKWCKVLSNQKLVFLKELNIFQFYLSEMLYPRLGSHENTLNVGDTPKYTYLEFTADEYFVEHIRPQLPKTMSALCRFMTVFLLKLTNWRIAKNPLFSLFTFDNVEKLNDSLNPNIPIFYGAAVAKTLEIFKSQFLTNKEIHQ